jgi:apolipoprotein N-acyltransferase
MSEPQQGHVSWSPDYKHEKKIDLLDVSLAKQQAILTAPAEKDREIKSLRASQRLSSLQALMERVPHVKEHRLKPFGESKPFEWCATDCPRCAYEKWKEGEK